MRFLAALRFLTVIRLPWLKETSSEHLKHSAGYFPFVGIVIGMLLAVLNWMLSFVLPQSVVNVLLIVASVLITGALHIDGFLDTCDGAASNKTPQERWRIMDDSRAGGFGVIGVACLLLTKYVSLNSIPAPLLPVTLVLMPVMGRWAMVYAIFAYPYAKPSGLGQMIKPGTTWHKLALATSIALVAAIAGAYQVNLSFFYLAGLLLLALIWLLVVTVAAHLRKKFAGLTGDTYGAINEIAELWCLILVSALAHVR